MDIKLLPIGADIFVDSNIFLYHLENLSPECTELLERIARGEINACITPVVLAEVLHRRMMAEALTKGLISSGQPLKKLKSQPQIITALSDYIVDLETLLTLPWLITEATADDVKTSHTLRSTYGLFVNDSINLACALRLGITDIATHDADFTRVPLVTVLEPTDV